MKSWHLLFAIVLAFSLSVFSMNRIFGMHTRSGEETRISRLVHYPASFVKAAALEFHGVVADYLMLNTMILHGEKLIELVPPTARDWKLTYLALKVITELDPRFMDPYILAESSLPWDAGMVAETNELLLKAAASLPNDYRPYYYLWFNYSYFLHDDRSGVQYLEKAARIPGAPSYFKTLAARKQYEVGSTVKGIIFLQEMLKEIGDPIKREPLQKRLHALKMIYLLEQKVVEYEKKYQKRPAELAELVSNGLLEKMPQDPYGGEFFIMENGRVYTTSKLVLHVPPKK